MPGARASGAAHHAAAKKSEAKGGKGSAGRTTSVGSVKSGGSYKNLNSMVESIPSSTRVRSEPLPENETKMLVATREERAAILISRAWRRSCENSRDRLDRKNLVERLLLEDAVCVGITRLTLFIFIFLLLIWATQVGTPATEKSAVDVLLRETLALDEWSGFHRLQDIRDALRPFSEKIKGFSASGSIRFPNEESMILLGPEVNYLHATPVKGLDIDVTGYQFTFSAWVSKDPTAHHVTALVRKPLSTNTALSCWGWFYPGSFKFGAHDFHALHMDEDGVTWEEAVVGTTDWPADQLNHLALVVNTTADHVHWAYFYKNGQLVSKALPLPRSVTDCVGTVELGGDHVALSSFKYYPRALPQYELEEIINRGQPLSEIATGSVLHQLQGDQFADLQVVVEQSRDHTEEILEEFDHERSVSDLLATMHLAETEAVSHAALFTTDSSPSAALHPDQPSSFLPHEELHLWEHDYHYDRDINGTIVDEWRFDSVSGGGSYWAAFDEPLYSKASTDPEEDVSGKNHDTNPLVKMNFTDVPADTEVLTFTYWIRAIRPEEKFSLVMRIGAYNEYDILGYHWLSYGGELLRVTNPTTDETWHQTQVDSFGAYQIYGPLDEKLYITAYNHDAEPAIWRFCSLVMYLKDGKHKVYIDGRMVKETYWHGIHDITIAHMTGKYLTFNQASWYSTSAINAKVAQFRMYPRELEQNILAKIQANAVWPSGVAMKQCLEVRDNTFGDTNELDSEGRNCAWYHEQMRTSTLVCHSAAAKAMCPMTCRGFRECNTGYPFDNKIHDYETAHDTDAHNVYRIFDRVMHLQPRHDDTPTIICPGKSQSVSKWMTDCEHSNSTYAADILEGDFAMSIEHSWEGFKRADLRNCEEIEHRVDESQCAWDDSWMPQFREEWATKQKFSITFWTKPSPNSRGMPDEFVHAVNFFATVAPPRTLLDVREQHPYQEAVTRLAIPMDDGHHETSQKWSDVRHGGNAHFEKGWTFYYISFKKLSDHSYEQCLAINGYFQDCQHTGAFGEQPGYRPIPEEFLSAFEVTAEVLISPIEMATDVLSTSEIQERYYMTYPRHKGLIGPRITEFEYQEEQAHQSDTDIEAFPERLLLAAPPLLYQTRRQTKESCSSEAMRIFREEQLTLVKETHCSIEGSCPHVHDVNDIYACKNGDYLHGTYYGISATMLFGQDVFADFLYTIADNDVIVRNGTNGVETLETSKFLDAETDHATILCLFHSPDTGDTTYLKVEMTFEGSKITVEPALIHYGFLSSTQLNEAALYWGFFFALCAITLIVNLGLWWTFLEEAKLFPDVGFDKKQFAQVLYDVFQVCMLLAYSLYKFSKQRTSEDHAKHLVQDFADVPFREQGQTVQEKVDAFFTAVTTMQTEVDAEKQTMELGFFIMILMLVRIIMATAVHPRTEVLIGTMKEGANDLWHFTILFMIVFLFSSLVSNWSFSDRPEFGDLQTSMKTQFELLLGGLPEEFEKDWTLTIYVALTNIVMFFLMLNFLLAIVVEAYMKVREHIEACETENEITYDLCLAIYYKVVGLMNRWPTRRRLAVLLQSRLAKRNVSWTELHVLGLNSTVSKSIIGTYKNMEVLEMQEFKAEMTLEKVGQMSHEIKSTTEKESMRITRLQNQVTALTKGMEILLQKQLGDEYDESILRPPDTSRSRRASACISTMMRDKSGISQFSSRPSQGFAFASDADRVSKISWDGETERVESAQSADLKGGIRVESDLSKGALVAAVSTDSPAEGSGGNTPPNSKEQLPGQPLLNEGDQAEQLLTELDDSTLSPMK